MADEHNKQMALELRLQLQIRFSKLEEDLDSPMHAVNTDDLGIFQHQICAKQNTPTPLPISGMHKNHFDRQTADDLNDDRAKDFFVLDLR